MNKAVIILHGPSCSGKSVVADEFFKDHPGYFRVSMDKIKWLISDYSAEKYTGKGMVNRMTFALAEAAVKEGLALVVESNIGILKNWRAQYRELAEKNGLKFIEINIEAPYEILRERFFARLKAAEKEGKPLSMKDEEGMKNRYDAYIETRDQSLPTFDSSNLTKTEIVKEIERLL